MIKSAVYTNFQSHKKTVLEFAEGLNVIVGPSDSGKTALLRGLKWNATNKPTGDEFRSYGSEVTSVEVLLDTDDVVVRMKSSKSNEYWLNDTQLKAFNKDVPEEVRNMLNMDSINIQEQMDSPFLISETSGNVAAHFNKIANLEDIDKATSAVQAEINRLTKIIGNSSEEMKIKQEQLDNFVDIDAIAKALHKVDVKKAKYDGSEKSITSLESAIGAIETLDAEISVAEELVEMSDEIDAALVKMATLKENRQTRKDLRELSVSLYNTDVKIDEFADVLKAETSINAVLKKMDTRDLQTMDINVLKIACGNLDNNAKKTTTAKIHFDKVVKEYWTGFPDICPLCESKIKQT